MLIFGKEHMLQWISFNLALLEHPTVSEYHSCNQAVEHIPNISSVTNKNILSYVEKKKAILEKLMSPT